MSDRYPQLEVTSRERWRAWLADHGSSPGVWLVTYKKAHAGRHVGYEDIVEEALCFGWVDSLRRAVDGDRSQLLLTPRKARSNWSRANKLRVERLLAGGLMHPAGLAVVDVAKADGSWTALDAVEAGVEPDDLAVALDADADARRYWDGFPRSTKRAILQWIVNAKKPQTRAERIRETAELAAQDIRANQPRQLKRR